MGLFVDIGRKILYPFTGVFPGDDSLNPFVNVGPDNRYQLLLQLGDPLFVRRSDAA